MARIHKGGCLSTNLLLFRQTSFCSLQTRFVKKRVKTRHMTYENQGLSTNLLCEFGPMIVGPILMLIKTIEIQILEFCRKLRLKDYFESKKAYRRRNRNPTPGKYIDFLDTFSCCHPFSE